MPPPTLRTTLKAPSALTRRNLHTTRPHRASILFALASLSNSRETQHFNKLTQLPRFEHSPPLKLIQTSEIHPFPIPLPPPAPAHTPIPAALDAVQLAALAAADREALALGRSLLADHARQRERWVRALRAAGARAEERGLVAERERGALEGEVVRLRRELRDAAVLVVGLVAAATAVAVYQVWPGVGAAGVGAGGQRVGAGMVERGTQTQTGVGEGVGGGVVPVVVGSEAVVQPVLVQPAAAASSLAMGEAVAAPGGSWWKGWFWKQQQ